MQTMTPQNYLIQLGEDVIYYFYLDKEGGLNYNTYTNSNVLLKSEKLLPQVIQFSVARDMEQNIYLVCLTREGELLYYIRQNDNWRFKAISKFDTRSNFYGHLSLHICPDYTHIICTKTNILNRALSTIEHMYWDKFNTNKLVVSSYIHGKYSSPLQICFDSLKNIHLVFKVFYENNHQLCYCKFNILSKTWTSGEIITDLKEDHSHPYIFVDTKDNLHLAWSTIEDNNFILRYKRKANVTATKTEWSKVQVLSDKNTNIISPIIIQQENILKIYCRQNKRITEIISRDLGGSWTGTDNSKSYFIENPKIIRYYQNLDENSYFVKHIYGSVGSRIELIGINPLDKDSSKELSNGDESLYVLGQPDEGSQNHRPVYIETDIHEEIDIEDSLTGNLVSLVQDIDKKINKILLQVTEYESRDLGQVDEPDILINDLLYNYNTLKNELIKIEEEKRVLVGLINDYRFNINLLEERIINFKGQMSILQERFNKLTANNNLFQRFIGFFK